MTERKHATKHSLRYHRLASFIQEKVLDPTETPAYIFAEKYGIGKTTLGQIMSGKNQPSLSTLIDIARAISQATGEEITATHLTGLLDPDQAPTEISVDEIDYSALYHKKQLLEAYKALPYPERLQILVDLQRAITDDVELAVATPQRRLAILVEREKTIPGIGYAKLAENIGVQVSVLNAIVKEKEIHVPLDDLRRLADGIRDERGEYGNWQIISHLLKTDQMSIRLLIDNYMQEQSIDSIPALAKHLLEDVDLVTAPASEARKTKIVNLLKKIVRSDELPSQNEPENFGLIVPTLAKALGFPDAQTLYYYTQQGKNGSEVSS